MVDANIRLTRNLVIHFLSLVFMLKLNRYWFVEELDIFWAIRYAVYSLLCGVNLYLVRKLN